jgi:hypothetical protein
MKQIDKLGGGGVPLLAKWYHIYLFCSQEMIGSNRACHSHCSGEAFFGVPQFFQENGRTAS